MVGKGREVNGIELLPCAVSEQSAFAQGTNVTAPNFTADYYPFGLQYRQYIRTGSPKNNYLYHACGVTSAGKETAGWYQAV